MRTNMQMVLTAILLSSLGMASAQEIQRFRLPDSIHVLPEPFVLPSLSVFVPSPAAEHQVLAQNDIALPALGLLTTYNAAWKRSFILGATVDKGRPLQLTPPVFQKKEGWLERIGMALGYAEFAGVTYLAYRAVKESPITKREKDRKKK